MKSQKLYQFSESELLFQYVLLYITPSSFKYRSGKPLPKSASAVLAYGCISDETFCFSIIAPAQFQRETIYWDTQLYADGHIDAIPSSKLPEDLKIKVLGTPAELEERCHDLPPVAIPREELTAAEIAALQDRRLDNCRVENEPTHLMAYVLLDPDNVPETCYSPLPIEIFVPVLKRDDGYVCLLSDPYEIREDGVPLAPDKFYLLEVIRDDDFEQLISSQVDEADRNNFPDDELSYTLKTSPDQTVDIYDELLALGDEGAYALNIQRYYTTTRMLDEADPLHIGSNTDDKQTLIHFEEWPPDLGEEGPNFWVLPTYEFEAFIFTTLMPNNTSVDFAADMLAMILSCSFNRHISPKQVYDLAKDILSQWMPFENENAEEEEDIIVEAMLQSSNSSLPRAHLHLLLLELSRAKPQTTKQLTNHDVNLLTKRSAELKLFSSLLGED